MSRALLSGFRVRILNTNGNPDSRPQRLAFFDGTTSLAKAVYSGPGSGDAALGVVVALDSTGYGPAAGIWLEVGTYDMLCQVKISNTGVDAVDWLTQWTLDKIPGGTIDSTVTDSSVRFFDTVSDLRQAVVGGFAYLTGYYSVDDGGQGPVRWVSDSMHNDDGGAWFKPTAISSISPGRWERVFTESELSVTKWGAITGVADCSTNIRNAFSFASRTANDTGNTILFPAGEYNIGTSSIAMTYSGLDLAGHAKPVSIHLHENAFFTHTPQSGSPVDVPLAILYFGGPTRIDGTSALSDNFIQVEFTDMVNDGIVRPEWFGADPTGAATSDLSFLRCWMGMGDNDVLISGKYELTGAVYNIAHTNTNGNRPTLRLANKQAYINIAASSKIFEIGEIVAQYRNSSNPIFKGAFDAYAIYADSVASSMFYLPNVSSLTLLVASLRAPSVEFIWDAPFTFHADWTSSATNVIHSWAIGVKWNLGGYNIGIQNAKLYSYPVFNFSSTSDTSTVNIANYTMYKSCWFSGGSVKQIIDSALEYGKDIDFEYQQLDPGSFTLTMSLGYVVTLYRYNFVASGTSFVINVAVSDGLSVMHLIDGRAKNGTIYLNALAPTPIVKGNKFDSITFHVSGSIPANISVLAEHNIFNNSSLYLTAPTSSTIGYVNVDNNQFFGTAAIDISGLLSNSIDKLFRLGKHNTPQGILTSAGALITTEFDLNLGTLAASPLTIAISSKPTLALLANVTPDAQRISATSCADTGLWFYDMTATYSGNNIIVTWSNGGTPTSLFRLFGKLYGKS